MKTNTDWEVLTPSGWQEFDGVKKIIHPSYIKLTLTNGLTIKCSKSHQLFVRSSVSTDEHEDGFLFAELLDINTDKIKTKNNDFVSIQSIVFIEEEIDMYDLVNVSNGYEYYANDIVNHNCAHISDMDEIWVGLSPTLSTGGKAILISTPLGVGNAFHRIWVDAIDGKNDFTPIELPWTVHPERNQEWYDRESANTRAGKGERGVQQEYHCVAGTTKIVTPDGHKEIQDIKLGDLVLTHKGRFRKVHKIYKRDFVHNEENLYEISAPGNRRQKLTITGNHPILTYKVKLPKHKKAKDLLLQAHPTFEGIDELHEWKHAHPNSTRRLFYASLFPQCSLESLLIEENKSINLVDWCTLPDLIVSDNNKTLRLKRQNINKSKEINICQELSYDFGRFVGLFAAEGYSSDKEIGFGFHSNEKDTLVKFVEDFFEKFGATKHTSTRDYSRCITVTSTNRIIKNLLEQFVNQNSGATTKTYNMENLLMTNPDFIRGVLVGHFQGDGDHPVSGLDNKLKVACYSTNMLYQLKTLLSCFGLFGRFGNQYEKIIYYELCGLENLEKENRNIEFLLSQKNPSALLVKPNSSYVLLQNEKQFVGKFQYKQLADENQLKVFNLGVEEDESYVADSIVVHNCSFNASGDTFAKTEILNILEQGIRDPIAKHPDYPDCWIWKYAQPGHKYLIAADVSRGNAADFSTFHVIDTTSDEVVCEFKSKVYPDVFADILIEVGKKYNLALICPELNTYGAHTATVLKKKGYPNLYYEKVHKNIYMAYIDTQTTGDGDLPGWTSGPKSRDEAIAKLDAILRNQVIRLPSKRLLNELKTFIWKNNKAQAMKGYNDDLVMALAIGVTLYETSGRPQYSQEELAASLIAGMSVNSTKMGTSLGDWGVREEKVQSPFFIGSRGTTSSPNKFLPQRTIAPDSGKSSPQNFNNPYWAQWSWVAKD